MVVVVESSDKASRKDCKIDDNMPSKFRQQIVELLKEFKHIF